MGYSLLALNKKLLFINVRLWNIGVDKDEFKKRKLKI